MINIFIKAVSRDIEKIQICDFNLYENPEDRTVFKKIINSLFRVGDKVFFFFSRIENFFTGDDELSRIKPIIEEKLKNQGQFYYLNKIDDKRFDAVAFIEFDKNTPDFIIDLWKYYYGCDFFIPQRDLKFEDFVEYLEINGVNDIDGYSSINDLSLSYKCIKGLDGDNLIVSYPKNNNYNLPDVIVSLVNNSL